MSSVLHIFKIETCAAFLQDTSGQDNSQEGKNGNLSLVKQLTKDGSSLRATKKRTGLHVTYSLGHDETVLFACKNGGRCLFSC